MLKTTNIKKLIERLLAFSLWPLPQKGATMHKNPNPGGGTRILPRACRSVLARDSPPRDLLSLLASCSDCCFRDESADSADGRRFRIAIRKTLLPLGHESGMTTVCLRYSNLFELLRRPPRFAGGGCVVPVHALLRSQPGCLCGRIFRTPSFAGRRLVAEGAPLRAGILELVIHLIRNELAAYIPIVKT
jgi:hypothetical protein